MGELGLSAHPKAVDTFFDAMDVEYVACDLHASTPFVRPPRLPH